MMLGFLPARAGIDAFRAKLLALVPWLGDRPNELTSWA
jgi:hypothetical protein